MSRFASCEAYLKQPPFRAACDGVKRVVHQGTRRTTKTREGRRRATKRDGSAASARAGARRAGACTLRRKGDGSGRHPGARASRPHAIPLPAAQFPCDAAPDHPAGGNAMGSAEAESWPRCRSTPVEEMGKALPVLCGRDGRGSRGGDCVMPGLIQAGGWVSRQIGAGGTPAFPGGALSQEFAHHGRNIPGAFRPAGLSPRGRVRRR